MQAKSLIIRVLFTTLVIGMFLFFLGRENVQFMLVPKYLLFLIVSLAAIIVLGMKKVPSLFRIIALGINFIVFGVLIGIAGSAFCTFSDMSVRNSVIFVKIDYSIMTSGKIA